MEQHRLISTVHECLIAIYLPLNEGIVWFTLYCLIYSILSDLLYIVWFTLYSKSNVIYKNLNFLRILKRKEKIADFYYIYADFLKIEKKERKK